jgi:hypothetical protein
MSSWRNEATLGIVLVLFGFAILASNLGLFHLGGALLGVLFFGGLGIVFLMVYRKGAANWWAVIPSGALFGLAAVSVLESSEGTPAGVSGAVFLWASGAPFALLFRREPRFYWASLPAGFLGILGVLALISGSRVGGALFAWLLYWGIGAIFAVLFLRAPSRWWAVIPAGSFFSLGVVELIERASWGGPSAQGFVFCLGLAATFGMLFLIRNDVNKLQWAKFPAVALAVISLLFLFSALSWGGFVKIVAIVMVLGGLYLLFAKRHD